MDDESRPAAAEPAEEQAPAEERPAVEFRLDPHSPVEAPRAARGARGERVAAGVSRGGESGRGRAFGAEDGAISLRNLEEVDGGTAEKLAHRARVVYNEFMISPWY